jgi:hypothetical protein
MSEEISTMKMHLMPFPARELATLDAVTSESPGVMIIIGCRMKDGTFVRGLLQHNQKDRLIVRARFHRRKNIPEWHPDSQTAEQFVPLEKSELTWLCISTRLSVRKALCA